jgi:hypothetical protein
MVGLMTALTGSWLSLTLPPSTASAGDCCGKARGILVLTPESATVPTGRAYVVRTTRTLSESEVKEDQSRTIVVRRLAPPAEPASSRSVGKATPQAARAMPPAEEIPPLLKTVRGPDGQLVPRVTGDEPATSRSASATPSPSRPRVIVRSTESSASREVVTRYIVTRSRTRSEEVPVRTVRAAELVVIVRDVAPTIVVRQTTAFSAVPVVIKKRCCWKY